MKHALILLLAACCLASAQSPSVLLFGHRTGGLTNTDTPDTFSTLRAWWKADALSLNDNDAVASWADSSGNSATLSQSISGARPTYKTALYVGADGVARPAVRFDGGDNLTNLFTTSLGAFDATLCVVARSTNSGVGGGCVFGHPLVNYQARVAYNGSNVMQCFNLTQDRNSGAVFSKAKGGLIFYVWRFYSSSHLDFSQNGTEFSADQTGGGMTIRELGDTLPAAGIPFEGDIAEACIYNGKLSDVNVFKLFLNMSEKWGVPPVPP